MIALKSLFKEKNLHFIFEISLIVKGVHALIEIISGVIIFFINKTIITLFVVAITHDELLEDPKDFIAHYLIKSAQHFSVSAQHFVAFYLVSHGIIKLVLVVELFRKKLWAYPASIMVFSIFIIYQTYRFTITYSWWLIVFTILDMVVIWLTIHEYHSMKKQIM
jgi:uncharacterized membrane protein